MRPQAVLPPGHIAVHLLLLAGSLVPSEARAQTAPQPMTKEAVEQIIRQYLMDHPR